MNINEVIKYPVLTEKTYQQMSQNIYTFIVDKRTTKIEIKKAVEFIFDVKVAKVNILTIAKKRKKLGRYHGFIGPFKKAIVYLKEGAISIFPDEGIASDAALKESKDSIKKIEEISEAEKKAAAKIKKASQDKAKKLENAEAKAKLVDEKEKKVIEKAKPAAKKETIGKVK